MDVVSSSPSTDVDSLLGNEHSTFDKSFMRNMVDYSYSVVNNGALINSILMDDLAEVQDHHKNIRLSPMAIFFIHRYLTNVLDTDLDQTKAENYYAPDAEALEVPLRLISKDVTLLISTYNSLRTAYVALKAKFEKQQKQLESVFTGENSSPRREESIKEWEDALQSLQEEWIKLQNEVDQASWSLFVLSQRKEISSIQDDGYGHSIPQKQSAENTCRSSTTTVYMGGDAYELENKEIQDIKLSAECEIAELRRTLEEELKLKKKAFDDEMKIKNETLASQVEREKALLDSNEIYKSLLEERDAKMKFLEQQLQNLQEKMSHPTESAQFHAPVDILKEQQQLLDSKLAQLESEFEVQKKYFRWEYEKKQSTLDMEIDARRRELEHAFEAKNAMLEQSFAAKNRSHEAEIESIKHHLQTEFDDLKTHLHADFEAKRSSLMNSERDFLSISQTYELQLREKEEIINQLHMQLDTRALQDPEFSGKLELKNSELNAISLQLEDFQQQLFQKEAFISKMEKERTEELNSREYVLASMEAALLARTKDEEAAAMSRSSAQRAISEDLKKRKATIDADRASLEADKEALASLASLLEERKSAIEASLLAQLESIEAERSKLIAEKSLLETQRGQHATPDAEKEEPLSKEKVELFHLALAQFEQEKQEFLKSKSLMGKEGDESFISQEDEAIHKSPAPSSKRGTKNYLMVSPLKSRNFISPPRPFKSPGFTQKRVSVLSQSFRRMLSKLASTSEKQREISLPLLSTSNDLNEVSQNAEPHKESCGVIKEKEEDQSSQNAFDLTSDLSALSYAEVPEHQEATDYSMEGNACWENETKLPIGKGKFTSIRHPKSLQRWTSFALQLEKNVTAICSHLKTERDKMNELTQALRTAEHAKVLAENDKKEILEQSTMQREHIRKESQQHIDQLQSKLEQGEERYNRLLGEFNRVKSDILASEEKCQQIMKEKQALSNGALLLEECSTILSTTDFDALDRTVEDTKSLSRLVKNSLTDINPEAFDDAISDILSDDTLSWLEIIDAKINYKSHSPKETVDLFLSIVDAKISTMIQEIILALTANGDAEHQAPLPALLAKALKRISKAVFLFSFGIFKHFRSWSTHTENVSKIKSHPHSNVPFHATSQTSAPPSLPSVPFSSSMLNERVQALEIALRVAEDEKRTLLRESTQHLAKIAALSGELSARSENKSAAYWKERCRFELDHRSDLVFQKRYLVLEITCLRSNELLLLSLLDQLSESIPNGILSPTPGLMSPSKLTTKIAVSSFPVIARAVLACIRWKLLIRRRARLMAAALSR